MLLKSKTEQHFILEDIENNTFSLKHDGEFLLVDNVNIIYSDHGSKFYVKNYCLKHNHMYVTWEDSDDKNYAFKLSDNISDRNVKVEFDLFDKPYYKKGSYAYIYYPSITSNKDNITRISINAQDFYEIPNEYKERYENFCLLPLNVEHKRNIVIEEYKKCKSRQEIEEYICSISFLDFMLKFRNLLIGLKEFKKDKFFHGDISNNNVVLDDDCFKFIDYDFSFFTNDIKKDNIFEKGEIYPIYPLAANLIIIRHISRITGNNINVNCTDAEYYRNQIEYYQCRFTFNNFGKLLIENFMPDQKTGELYDNFDIDNNIIMDHVFQYISLYQLIVVFLYYVNVIEKHTKISHVDKSLFKLLNKCLNFKIFGFVHVEAVIVLYDEIIKELTVANITSATSDLTR